MAVLARRRDRRRRPKGHRCARPSPPRAEADDDVGAAERVAVELLDRYELILTQAVEELGELEIPEDRKKAYELQAILAPTLGDILYRLTVEHGIEYTPFRETVIGLIADQDSVHAAPDEVFAPESQDLHSLILLALEMMPADSPG